MALTAEAFAEASRPRRQRCGMFSVLAALDAQDRAVVEQVLADGSINANAIARTLEANGHKVSQQTVQRHRREQCSCA